MFDIFHDCNRSTLAPTQKFLSIRLPEASSDPNIHNPMLSWRPATLKSRSLSFRSPGLSPTHQQKSPIAVLGNLLLVQGCLRKNVTLIKTTLRGISHGIANFFVYENDVPHQKFLTCNIAENQCSTMLFATSPLLLHYPQKARNHNWVLFSHKEGPTPGSVLLKDDPIFGTPECLW